MGLLDSLVSGVMKTFVQEAEARALPALLSQVLARTDLGSVGGLLAQLQQGGLDREVTSWLGRGTNLPVSADQLRTAFGGEQLQQLARAAGLPVDDLLKMLTQQLPGTIDDMSPNGTLEEKAPPPQPGGGSLADQAGLGDIKG